MIGYIKSHSDFHTITKVDVSSYDLVLGSIYDNVSKVSLIGEFSNLEGDFFIYEGRLWVIKSIAPGDGVTQLTLDDIVTIFSRQLSYMDLTASTIEDFISSTITAEFKSLSDTMYAMPYISVTATTGTDFILPDTEGGLWNLKSYISKVRRLKGVFVDFGIQGDTLTITVNHKVPQLHKIDFNGSNAQRVTETYERTQVAKITVNGTTDFYLFKDGTFSDDPTHGERVEGDWISLSLRDSDDILEDVANEFNKNSETHVIEYWTYAPCELYDSVQIRSRGVVTQSYLSLVRITSDDDRIYCKTGNLITDIQDYVGIVAAKVDGISQSLDALLNGQGEVDGDFSATGDIYEGGVRLSEKYGSGVTSYNDLTERPCINGVELVGDKTSADLHIVSPTPTLILDDVSVGSNTTRQVAGSIEYSVYVFDVKIGSRRTTFTVPAVALRTSAQEYYCFDGSSSAAGCQVWKSGNTIQFKRDGSNSCTLSVTAW